MDSTIFLLSIIVILTQVLFTMQRTAVPHIPNNWTIEDIARNTSKSDLGVNLCMFYLTDYRSLEVSELNHCYYIIKENYSKVVNKFTTNYSRALTEYSNHLKRHEKNITDLEKSLNCVLQAVTQCPDAIQNWINNTDVRMLAMDLNVTTPYKLYHNIMHCDTKTTLFLKQQLQALEPEAKKYYKFTEKIRRRAKKKSENLYKKLKKCLDDLETNDLPIAL